MTDVAHADRAQLRFGIRGHLGLRTFISTLEELSEQTDAVVRNRQRTLLQSDVCTHTRSSKNEASKPASDINSHVSEHLRFLLLQLDSDGRLETLASSLS